MKIKNRNLKIKKQKQIAKHQEVKKIDKAKIKRKNKKNRKGQYIPIFKNKQQIKLDEQCRSQAERNTNKTKIKTKQGKKIKRTSIDSRRNMRKANNTLK